MTTGTFFVRSLGDGRRVGGTVLFPGGVQRRFWLPTAFYTGENIVHIWFQVDSSSVAVAVALTPITEKSRPAMDQFKVVASWTSETASAMIEAVAAYTGTKAKTTTRLENRLLSMLAFTSSRRSGSTPAAAK